MEVIQLSGDTNIKKRQGWRKNNFVIFSSSGRLVAFPKMQQRPLLFSSRDRSLCLQFVLQTLLAPDAKKLHFYCDRLIQISSASPDLLRRYLRDMDHTELFAALLPFFDEVGKDENLISYCLENMEALNHLFGLRTVENLLLRLFPAGIDDLRLFLRERYEARGFYDYSGERPVPTR